MTAIPPMKFLWTGEEFKPVHPKFADRYLVCDQVYTLSEVRERSDKSHNHYFAVVHWAWESLPEEISDSFPSAEHLRARALIASGYTNSRQFVASTNAQAVRLAAFLAVDHEYSIVSIDGSIVTILSAQSQSYKAMGRDVFNKSKHDVIDYCASLIGVTVEQLTEIKKNNSARNQT